MSIDTLKLELTRNIRVVTLRCRFRRKCGCQFGIHFFVFENVFEFEVECQREIAKHTHWFDSSVSLVARLERIRGLRKAVFCENCCIFFKVDFTGVHISGHSQHLHGLIFREHVSFRPHYFLAHRGSRRRRRSVNSFSTSLFSPENSTSVHWPIFPRFLCRVLFQYCIPFPLSTSGGLQLLSKSPNVVFCTTWAIQHKVTVSN